MKKSLWIVLSLVLLLCFTACQTTDNTETETTTGTDVTSETTLVADSVPSTAGETSSADEASAADPVTESTPDVDETSAPDDASAAASDVPTAEATASTDEDEKINASETSEEVPETTDEETQPEGVAISLSDAWACLVAANGMSLTADGSLSVTTVVYGMTMTVKLPIRLSAVLCTDGAAGNAQIPFMGAYDFTVTDGSLYLSWPPDNKYMCPLPEFPTASHPDEGITDEDLSDETIPYEGTTAEPAWSWPTWSWPTLLPDVTISDTDQTSLTIPLSGYAQKLADALRAQAEAYPPAGEEEDGAVLPDLTPLISLLDGIAAGDDARLTLSAAMVDEQACLSVSLFCPVDLSALPPSDVFPMSPASASGDLSLTVTLTTGHQTVTAPEDPDAYVETDVEEIVRAIWDYLQQKIQDQLPSDGQAS